MNEALLQWKNEFVKSPDVAFDRLLNGVVPLGSASQLSFGEILDDLFEPGDAALDEASANWLRNHILGPIPSALTLRRWVFVLEEYFRGIAIMELPKTNELLRDQHARIRLWLHDFYDGMDRDPEGTYLIALVRAQNTQKFSPLWRGLILGSELVGRPYVNIGILGFRKMPGSDGKESSDVPGGLLRALVELAEQPGTVQSKWVQTVRSLFATYRRSEQYWVEHFSPLLPNYRELSNAREWLSGVLTKLSSWRPNPEVIQSLYGRVLPVSRAVCQDWVQRVRNETDACDTLEFSIFLEAHRVYAKTTGDSEYLNKTFNNIAMSLARNNVGRVKIAVSLIEEALNWAPEDPRNWTSYGIILTEAGRRGDAVDVLWEARHRFAFEPFIRNELGRLLRENGDLLTAEGVLREASSHFPADVVCRTGLAETLRAMGRHEDARDVYLQACADFPNNTFCRNGLAETFRELGQLDNARLIYEQASLDFPADPVTKGGLADLLIETGEVDKAELLYRKFLEKNKGNLYARSGLARALSIRSAKSNDIALRDEAKNILIGLANEGVHSAKSGLLVFDDQWKRAMNDPNVTFRRESGIIPSDYTVQMRDPREIVEMGTVERLGRAMIGLWQLERAQEPTLMSVLTSQITELLDLPEEVIDAKLLTAFVETRGLVLLASGDATQALQYFDEQINKYGRGSWIGVRLGRQRASIRLGTYINTDSRTVHHSSESVRFALHVASVIEALSVTQPESAVRVLLKSLYPEAAKFAVRAKLSANGGLVLANGAEMIGSFLQTCWFHPAGVLSEGDLDDLTTIRSIADTAARTRTDTFDVIANATLMLAA